MGRAGAAWDRPMTLGPGCYRDGGRAQIHGTCSELRRSMQHRTSAVSPAGCTHQERSTPQPLAQSLPSALEASRVLEE